MKRIAKTFALAAALAAFASCSSVVTSIKEEDGRYFMTLQQYGGVRGTIHGKVWKGTYDRATNTMHVHEVGRGALTQSPGT